MKNFICTMPYQDPKEPVYSNPCANPVLNCSEKIKYPILILIQNTVKNGEKIRITAVNPDYQKCHENYGYFLEDLEKLKSRIGFEYEINTVETPYSERIEDHLDLFGKMIDTIHDDEELYADISYGSKPIPIILLMVLTYAYRFRNGFIENIIYGLLDHNSSSKSGRLYDVTALFYMNSTINTMSDSSDPKKFIKAILEL